MPVVKSRLLHPRRYPQLQRRPESRQTAQLRCKLDIPTRLIAPAHTLSLPTLEGVKDCFEFSLGCDAALPLARALIRRSLLSERHLQHATSPVGAVEAALVEIVSEHFHGAQDEFDVSVCITDRLEDYRKPEGVLFFIWSNSPDPQYIPLRPVFERLENNPYRDRLMANLYRWLDGAASKVFDAFGFDEAKSIYTWRKEWYTEAREIGEHVDVESEVEASDPAKVVSYIRDSERLALEDPEAIIAIRSITDEKLRSAFATAREMYLAARKIKLPGMSEECRRILDDAAYYMDAYPVPGLAISHWRDDPIVAWFDEFCQEQFESGSTCRAPIILCFRPEDTTFFLQIVAALPRLVQTVAALSEWTRFSLELENASNYGDR
jgi:hypothetical protein